MRVKSPTLPISAASVRFTQASAPFWGTPTRLGLKDADFHAFTHFAEMLWPGGHVYQLVGPEELSLPNLSHFATVMAAFAMTAGRLEEYTMTLPVRHYHTALSYSKLLEKTTSEGLASRSANILRQFPPFVLLAAVTAYAWLEVLAWRLGSSRAPRLWQASAVGALCFAFSINTKGEALSSLRSRPPFASLDGLADLLRHKRVRLNFNSKSDFTYKFCPLEALHPLKSNREAGHS